LWKHLPDFRFDSVYLPFEDAMFGPEDRRARSGSSPAAGIWTVSTMA
jgi:hypothetical protein